MSGNDLKPILDLTYRANPAYQVIPFAHLSAPDRKTLGSLTEDADFFGVLRPGDAGEGLNMKAVCQRSALLFYALERPGPLPAFVHRLGQEQGSRMIAEMVLDGVLEIARNDGFISGSKALREISPAPPRSEAPDNHIARISRDAARFGQRLPTSDPQRLSAQLYFYYRAPVTPSWQQRLGSSTGWSDFLGFGGALGELLKAEWQASKTSQATLGWRSWRRRGESKRRRRKVEYKLYVSPRIDAVPEALAITVGSMTELGVRQFKIGADASGLMRPDKIVIYLDDEAQVSALAADLTKKLHGFPAHGVPFTGAVEPSGLLSWGVDPGQAPALDWQERPSWRLWITNRLATSLLAAKADGAGSVEDREREGVEQETDPREPWQFALERLRLDGIDTDTFTPNEIYLEKIRPSEVPS